MALSTIRAFLRQEVSGAVFLMAAALVAMILASSPLRDSYTHLLHLPLGLAVGERTFGMSLQHLVNDGLMAVFFLLVGLEIKREVLVGELSCPRRAALPLVAALGGMAVPALVYLAVTTPDPLLTQGWAIPAGTDIAFAVGVLALIGRRAPPSLRIFLLALAIIDDLGSILIIALAYTADLSLTALGLAGVALAGLIAANRAGIRSLAVYGLLGLVLWGCVVQSGLHATLAGVAVGLLVPLGRGDAPSPLHRLEHALHPWVAYAILPLFAFVNAGVSLSGVTLATLLSPLTVGVALGLFVGKQVGVMATGMAMVRLGLAALPAGASLRQFYGTAVLTGIGFTMSLFIGTLAFPGGNHDDEIRLGVMGGSMMSALLGYAILRWSSADRPSASTP